jgi:holliday junction DNA helicase RuvB
MSDFMEGERSYIESSFSEKDVPFEVTLRPQSLNEFIGQDLIRKRLQVSLTAAKERQEPMGHCLFCGPPGLGKTTLATTISKDMGTNLVYSSGPSIEKAGDLAGILTNLQEGDVLFVDEIHRLNKTVEEYLYTAMEDYVLDLVIDSGPSARTVQMKLNPFTLVGATTRSGQLSAPFRSRFNSTFRLDYYKPEVLQTILARSGTILNLELEQEASLEIAKRSRGTPRIANNLLKWTRDFAQVHHGHQISKDIACEALEMLSIDHLGLDEMDKKILKLIIENYKGGPVGLGTLAVAIGEEKNTIEEVYEPYLIMQGFIKRTPRGREVTHAAYAHMEIPLPAQEQKNDSQQSTLFD